MVFNAAFNNISAISWRSVLLVEETGVPGENHQPVVRESTIQFKAKYNMTRCSYVISRCKTTNSFL